MTAITEQPSLPLTLPPKPERAWREHTGERWKERNPDAFDFFLHLVREESILCVSELARRTVKEFGLKDGQEEGLRKVYGKLLRTEFTDAELQEIRNKDLLLGSAIGAATAVKLLPEAKVKDIGAVGMTAKILFDMHQIANDKPTEIVEERKRFSLEDFQAMRAKAAGTVMDAEVMPAPALPSVPLPVMPVTTKQKEDVKP